MDALMQLEEEYKQLTREMVELGERIKTILPPVANLSSGEKMRGIRPRFSDYERAIRKQAEIIRKRRKVQLEMYRFQHPKGY